MRRTVCQQFRQRITQRDVPLIRISNATFYRQHPKSYSPSPKEVAHDLDSDAPDTNPPLFPNCNFTLPSKSTPQQHWSVISPSSTARTAFLDVLRGQHLCFPPTSRSFPYLATLHDPRLRYPGHAIQYVGFDAERGDKLSGSNIRGAYLSARYESRREETDFNLGDFLLGNTELNADETLVQHPDESLLERVMDDLKLGSLREMPVTHLSNGQIRRAQIAKALLGRPEVLLLDGPFMGLDPMTRELLSDLLFRLADARSPRVILSLKPDEDIPEWITHVALIDQNYKLDSQGPKETVFEDLQRRKAEVKAQISSTNASKASRDMLALLDLTKHLYQHTEEGKKKRLNSLHGIDWRWRHKDKAMAETAKKTMPATTTSPEETEELYIAGEDKTESETHSSKENSGDVALSRDAFPAFDTHLPTIGSPIVELAGVQVRYGNKTVLGAWENDSSSDSPQPSEGLHWTVRRGERWGVFGPNGSGKTTLLSLLTSDHPQTYSLPIKLFGRTRLPSPSQPGLSIFDLQARIGHSSPEVHTFFPKTVSVRRAIESAWADTPLSKPRLTHDVDEKVSACLRWFQSEIHPSLGPRPWMAREMMRPPNRDQKWVEFDGKAAPVPGQGLRYKIERDQGKTVNYGRDIIEKALEEMETECLDPYDLTWADELRFGEVSFSAQRVLLFLRAIIKNPELVVLDEAFSGMDDWARDKCLLFLSHGETMMFRYLGCGLRFPRFRSTGPRPMRSDMDRLGRVKVGGLTEDQALIVVSHKKEEVPGCVREWLALPEAGTGMPPRTGRLQGPLELSWSGWRTIWGLPTWQGGRQTKLKRVDGE